MKKESSTGLKVALYTKKLLKGEGEKVTIRNIKSVMKDALAIIENSSVYKQKGD